MRHHDQALEITVETGVAVEPSEVTTLHPHAETDGCFRDCLGALGGEAVVGGDPELTLRALELSVDPVLLIGPDRRIRYANRPTADLTGTAVEEIVGRACAEGMGFRTCGTRCNLYELGRVCGRECELVSRQGQRVRLLKTARLLRAPDGRVVGGLERLVDITPLHEERERLRVQADDAAARCALLEAAAERTDDPVVGVDLEGRICVVSPRAAALLHADAARLRGRALEEVVRGDLASLLSSMRERSVGARTELRLRRRGPSTALLASVRQLELDSGAVLGGLLELHADAEGKGLELAPGLIGRSAALRKLASDLRRLAASDASVLISGETGTGKEVVASALHRLGPRSARPFHAINCAALTEPLLESELFGHERGAFTGAVAQRRGRLEQCADGTLLLDEIGCLSPALQAKLLRVIEQREFQRVGGDRTLRLQARVLAATNSNLEAEVRAGRFRADLFYRLQAIPLEVPPLRRRREDVVPLARHFLRMIPGGADRRLGADAVEALEGHSWPGNVRELRNAIDYAASLGRTRVIGAADLPDPIRRCHVLTSAGDEEGERIRRALEATHYHRARAAEVLGISRATLWRQMRRYALD